MRAVKIDVEKRQVYEFEFEGGLANIYSAIGNNCDNIECPIRFDSKTHFGNAMYCDGEILFRESDWKGSFSLEGWVSPIMNNAIIVGTDSEGNDISHDIDIDLIENQIRWY